MTDNPRDPLLDLASRVSDGREVDWESDEASGIRRGLDGLRTLSKVAAAFGSLHEPPPAESAVLFRWGPLEVIEQISAGQFGEVFRARDPQVGRDVALKLDHGRGSLARTWLAEAQRLAQVQHPNVLSVYGAAVHDQRAGIWTELLTGLTLEERLQRDGPLGASELVAVGGELCQALAAVHGAGLVHGDLKTSNVVRAGQGKWVLIDFGAAQLASRDATPRQGTPDYLAPEVAAGEPPTPAADLFALGAVLFRLATGQHRAATGSSTLRDLRPDLPLPLVTTVDGLLSERPADRPSTAGRAERRLMAAGFEASPSPRHLVRHWWPVALIGLLSLGAALGWWLQRVRPVAEELVFEASLWGRRGGTAVELAQGADLRPGDELTVSLELDQPTHVYIFNEDDDGLFFVLFPLPGVAPDNPLRAGEHRLPGALAGEQQSWQVTSAGGRERFLIVGSQSPLDRLEELLQRSAPAARQRPVELSGGFGSERLRGIGGLKKTAGSTGESLLSQLHTELRQDDSVWAELWVLDNPL